MCRLSRNLWASTSWNPKGLSRPVMGLLYLYLSQTILREVNFCCSVIPLRYRRHLHRLCYERFVPNSSKFINSPSTIHSRYTALTRRNVYRCRRLLGYDILPCRLVQQTTRSFPYKQNLPQESCGVLTALVGRHNLYLTMELSYTLTKRRSVICKTCDYDGAAVSDSAKCGSKTAAAACSKWWKSWEKSQCMIVYTHCTVSCDVTRITEESLRRFGGHTSLSSGLKTGAVSAWTASKTYRRPWRVLNRISVDGLLKMFLL